jgi:tRNA(fMet)-specific endonuclease VapC
VIKQRPLRVMEKFRACDVGDIVISSITVSELWYGVAKSQHQAANSKALQQFLLPLNVVSFDERAAEAYGEIRAVLEQAGEPIGGMDLLIAAQAVSLGIPLVTNNEREFTRVPDLIIENWASV